MPGSAWSPPVPSSPSAPVCPEPGPSDLPDPVYRIVLFSHVLGAIVSVGPAITYGVWLTLARRAGAREEAFAFRGSLWLDGHLVTPAFGWQLVSGLLLVFTFHAAPIDAPWLVASLAIYGVLALLGAAVVAPRARRASAALERNGSTAHAYLAYRRMMRTLSPLISLGTLTIVYLMVTKPG